MPTPETKKPRLPRGQSAEPRKRRSGQAVGDSRLLVIGIPGEGDRPKLSYQMQYYLYAYLPTVYLLGTGGRDRRDRDKKQTRLVDGRMDSREIRRTSLPYKQRSGNNTQIKYKKHSTEKHRRSTAQNSLILFVVELVGGYITAIATIPKAHTHTYIPHLLHRVTATRVFLFFSLFLFFSVFLFSSQGPAGGGM